MDAPPCSARGHPHPRAGEKEGSATDPSPVDRRTRGSKHRLVTDGGGLPLKVITTVANAGDVTQTPALVDGVSPVAGRVGHPRKRSDAVLGDKGYDSNPNRRQLRRRGILPAVSRRGEPEIHGLGTSSYRVMASSPRTRKRALSAGTATIRDASRDDERSQEWAT
ncbi:transposase [Streptacidiphilus sp. ASG 303]|uniref:transposase n=1 Tax=Streptacidiphilus sp. ASG 303 TaxID=2896847 RepID=UPI0035B34F0F